MNHCSPGEPPLATVILFEKVNWRREAKVYLFGISKILNLCVCVRGLSAELAQVPSYMLQCLCFLKKMHPTVLLFHILVPLDSLT